MFRRASNLGLMAMIALGPCLPNAWAWDYLKGLWGLVSKDFQHLWGG